MNSWTYPAWGCDMLDEAGITASRVFIPWWECEQTDIIPPSTGYLWTMVENMIPNCLTNAGRLGHKVHLAIYDSPAWARSNSSVMLSYPPAKYAEFITGLLEFCERTAPGVVDSVDFGNEDITWTSRMEKDPSWYYQHILRAGYAAVKAFNPDIKVLTGSLWGAVSAHQLDEMYQLGLGSYFDRINLHYYVQGMGQAEDPSYMGDVWHYPTTIRYLKYIAEQNGDPEKLLWNTEYAWKIAVTEPEKSGYYQQILDYSRRSGFVDMCAMYPGLSEDYPSGHDLAALIYCNDQSTPTTIIQTTSYFMYRTYTPQYPTWNPALRETLPVIPGASTHVAVANPGFENAIGSEWTGATRDTAQRHSGAASGRASNNGAIVSQYYDAESSRLYEVLAWIKIDASNPANFYVLLYNLYASGPSNTGVQWWGPPHYDSVVDTRHYPGTWRRLRYLCLIPANKNRIALRFEGHGTGTFWIDDVQIRALNMPEPTVIVRPDVRITSPASGTTFTAPAGITVQAWARDDDGTVTSVSFYTGTTILGEDSVSPYTFTWNNVMQGSYTLIAVARDNQGYTSTSAPRTVSVLPSGTTLYTLTAALTPPHGSVSLNPPGGLYMPGTVVTLSPVLPGDGAYEFAYWTGTVIEASTKAVNSVLMDSTTSVTGMLRWTGVAVSSPVHGSTFTAPADIMLRASVTSPHFSVTEVRFYAGTTLIGTDTSSPYTVSWTGVAAGTYSIRAVGFNQRPESSTSSAIAVIVNPPPNQPPTVTMTSPVNNSTYTAPTDIPLAATATDSDGTIASVRFYRGSTLLATDTASPYEYTWTNVSSGTYQLRAVAQDNQGATSTSTVVTVTVLSSSTPAVWYTLTTAANPANGGTVSPASGTYLAGSQIQVTATPNANYTFATWSGDASGTNPTVTLTMDSNKTLTANFTYTPPVNSSPSVTITSPADGATFTAPASITITATATDSDGSIAAVRFYSGTTLLNTDSASPYSYSWTGVAAGTYVLTAQAEDNGGAVGISPAVTVTVNPGTQQPQPVLEPGEVRVIGGQDGYINATTNPNVTIRFRRTTAGMVTVKIYDLRGRLVAEKVKDGQAGIDDDVAWNAADLSAGVYLIVTKGGGIEQTQRSAVIR